MKLNLPNSVASAQDIKALLIELQDYSRWFAHEAIKTRTHTGHTAEPPLLSPATAETLRDWDAKKQMTQPSLAALIEAIEAYGASAPTVTLTLAAPPTSDLKLTLVEWCRKNIAPDILVNFQFNSTLLGGMVVRFGSHIFDWSFRRQILAARAHFPEVLRRV